MSGHILNGNGKILLEIWKRNTKIYLSVFIACLLFFFIEGKMEAFKLSLLLPAGLIFSLCIYIFQCLHYFFGVTVEIILLSVLTYLFYFFVCSITGGKWISRQKYIQFIRIGMLVLFPVFVVILKVSLIIRFSKLCQKYRLLNVLKYMVLILFIIVTIHINRHVLQKLYLQLHVIVAILQFIAIFLLVFKIVVSMVSEKAVAILLAIMVILAAPAFLLGHRFCDTVSTRVSIKENTYFTRGLLYSLVFSEKRLFRSPYLRRGITAEWRSKTEIEVDIPRFKEKPDIIMVGIDAMRADKIRINGSKEIIVPNVEKLIDKSVVFKKAYVQGNHTWSSFKTMFSSQYRMGLNSKKFDSLPNLTSFLKDEGYTTAGCPARISRFCVGDTDWDLTNDDNCAPNSTAWALEVLRSVDDPLFLFMHYTEPHAPYSKREGFVTGDTPIDYYNSELRFCDHYLGKVLKFMETGLRKRPYIFILFSDHGEGLGDHDFWEHGHQLYDTIVCVPLVIHIPDGGKRAIDAPVQLIDIFPTIVELLGKGRIEGIQGSSLAPYIFSPNYKNILIHECVFSDDEEHVCLIKNGRKLIYTPEYNLYELYDLMEDPKELHNLADKDPETVREMAGIIEQFTFHQQKLRLGASAFVDRVAGIIEKHRYSQKTLGLLKECFSGASDAELKNGFSFLLNHPVPGISRVAQKYLSKEVVAEEAISIYCSDPQMRDLSGLLAVYKDTPQKKHIIRTLGDIEGKNSVDVLNELFVLNDASGNRQNPALELEILIALAKHGNFQYIGEVDRLLEDELSLFSPANKELVFLPHGEITRIFLERLKKNPWEGHKLLRRLNRSHNSMSLPLLSRFISADKDISKKYLAMDAFYHINQRKRFSEEEIELFMDEVDKHKILSEHPLYQKLRDLQL